MLILGETGTGKELVARALHQNSQRANQPFVAINCNALTETIFDSQLLGHIRGAFTGAHRDEPGAVRAAAGGTLFLDEIGDVPLPLQGKLLRVLQERTVTPVGSHKEYKVDVRFVAATNKDLEREVREERFRYDLYGRLRVQEFVIPPLRERLDDIPELVRHFEYKLPAEMKLIAPPTTTMEAIHVFSRYHWPGNVRELEHTMSRLLAKNSGGGVITGEAVVKELGAPPSIATTTRKLPRVVLPVN
ncbi:MAG: sigma 54-interacting transcriptional regulator [Acidobacteriota bacterium]|nr:sigma 54-interacting transcriptional regulator [Acidobacteriota bacterium]